MLKVSDICAAGFIKTELHVGLTFSNLALLSKNADRASRNAAHAQKAYDTALYHFQKTALEEESTVTIKKLLAQLQANLALLRSGPWQ